MWYNLIVKKFAIVLLIGILLFSSLVFVACKHDNDINENKKVFITISFDSNEIECTLPEDMTVEVSGTCINFALPIPSDVPTREGYEPAWFFDRECKTIFSATAVPSNDITLYLGYNPKTYRITYTNKDEYNFEGNFEENYVYGEGVPLPNVDLGVGYNRPKSGNWYYGEGENDYYTLSIPKNAIGDLVLTFKPKAIEYDIVYVSNLPDGVEMENPNILIYDVTMGRVELLPPSAEGKTFSHWEYRQVMSKAKKIEYLDLDLILDGMNFTIWAVWQNDEDPSL